MLVYLVLLSPGSRSSPWMYRFSLISSFPNFVCTTLPTLVTQLMCIWASVATSTFTAFSIFSPCVFIMGSIMPLSMMMSIIGCMAVNAAHTPLDAVRSAHSPSFLPSANLISSFKICSVAPGTSARPVIHLAMSLIVFRCLGVLTFGPP